MGYEFEMDEVQEQRRNRFAAIAVARLEAATMGSHRDLDLKEEDTIPMPQVESAAVLAFSHER